MSKPCVWEFKLANTINPNLEIEQTDFLFLDSLHTYNQVKKELGHANKVNKYIGFHDVVTHGNVSQDVDGEEGINKIIEEFLEENKMWYKIYYATFNHGILIIEKQ